MTMNTQINKDKLPQHIAVIMDGNGRWAKQQEKERIFGHQNAITAVRDTVECAAELGVKYLTLYAFSTENWNRPQAEVQGLMQLLVKCIHEETPTLQKNNVRLQTIGNTKSLPEETYNELMNSIEATSKNTGTTLILALSYSSRWEIKEAIKGIVADAKNGNLTDEDIDENTLGLYLNTKDYPDPDLLIRTSGEYRISNFLLWQIAYTELYFTQKLWPDFRKEDLVNAIVDYQSRQRRFGKTGDQITLK
ncbi:MAG: isoprenyl transferase [Bacteroidales bacterium]|nr:isoprenyl transferase [Bacteroidales bacterium]MBR5778475.1 isoprenyl transferase [Bacteroidales bacterium]